MILNKELDCSNLQYKPTRTKKTQQPQNDIDSVVYKLQLSCVQRIVSYINRTMTTTNSEVKKRARDARYTWTQQYTLHLFVPQFAHWSILQPITCHCALCGILCNNTETLYSWTRSISLRFRYILYRFCCHFEWHTEQWIETNFALWNMSTLPHRPTRRWNRWKISRQL